jgi:hypothetical protein
MTLNPSSPSLSYHSDCDSSPSSTTGDECINQANTRAPKSTKAAVLPDKSDGCLTPSNIYYMPRSSSISRIKMHEMVVGPESSGASSPANIDNDAAVPLKQLNVLIVTPVYPPSISVGGGVAITVRSYLI